MARLTFHGRPIVRGAAEGTTLVSPAPLSFWGGYDFESGEITDRRHPLSGQIATSRILGVPFSRGSSTTTAVLLEAIRAGTAPAAILTTENDSFFALAAIVARELYDYIFPIVMLSTGDYAQLASGDWVQTSEDGLVSVIRE
jgi:predicted aconitase with swiveling domain